MGDHFILLVDRLLMESTLEAAIQSGNLSMEATSSAHYEKEMDSSPQKMEFLNDTFSSRKLVECRICQDEDEDSNMESPCACRGSLKYAHRRCVQRWCNEKGDTMCEICLQNFEPGYIAPPPVFQIRGDREISRRNLNSSRLIATMVSTDHDRLDSEFSEYSSATTVILMWCTMVAVILMALLILRHTLPLIINGNNDYYPFPLLTLMFVRISGIFLPIYVLLRAVATIQSRRYQLAEPSISPIALSNPQLHLIHVH